MIMEINGHYPKIENASYIASTAIITGEVEMGENTNVWFSTVIRGDVNYVHIGNNSNIQDGCTIHCSTIYPTIIGNHTVLGHNAVVHACTVGDNVLVGIGAMILDGAVIEDNVIIGAGTLIPPGKIIKSNSVVMGNPYKVVRSFKDSDNEMIQGIINRYSDWSKVYHDIEKEVSK